MLHSLYVKNFALIKEAEVYFKEGLNILTGETGAGKSIIIGSINMALGAKITKEMMRDDAEYAYVELVFSIQNEKQLQTLKELEVLLEDDNQVILSRRISNGKSISKVNGETVTTARLKQIADLLIDIHGQHEHQTLLYKKNHLGILDEYGKAEIEPLLHELKENYKLYIDLKEQLHNTEQNEAKRLRELSLLEYEFQEIEAADLKPNEDSELENKFHFLLNAQKIVTAMTAVYELTEQGKASAAENIGYALKELSTVALYDDKIEKMNEQLMEIEGLLNDFNLDVSKFMSQMEFSENEIGMIEERLNTINHLKSKYGSSIKDIIAYQSETEKKLEQLRNYDEYVEKLKRDFHKQEERITMLCGKISEIRRKCGVLLAVKIKEILKDLGFINVDFEIQINKEDHFTDKGYDDVEFMISTNPGEPIKPLGKVASGGELSRIMLAIKTVLSGNDNIETLIFDEIDTGISGRTAQMVSEKLAIIAKSCQVICITHLPQIAAMADYHYGIQKIVEDNSTKTYIHQLTEEEIIEELARLIGGAKITDTVLQSAKEMKELAKRTVKY